MPRQGKGRGSAGRPAPSGPPIRFVRTALCTCAVEINPTSRQRRSRMQFLLAVAIWMLAGVPTLSLGAPVRSESVLVRAVIDGDTIDVATIGRVRLLGIDAPEIGRGFDTSAPFAREARTRLAAIVLHR